MIPGSACERRVRSALDSAPSRIPVILGAGGTGRTTLLHRLHEHTGRTACQYIDIERTATTPERFFQAVVASSPFRAQPASRGGATARQAFEATLSFLDSARAAGGERATFLLDEVLELRTFENFPGLRHVLRDLLDALAASGNRFVLTTRYVARALKLLRDASAQFVIVHVSPLTADEVHEMLPREPGAPEETGGPTRQGSGEANDVARVVQALSDGRVVYVRAITGAMRAMAQHGGGDAVSALTALLAPEGRLWALCGFWYELRLHRARGYGALKAILDVLAEEEPLTLTEIARRLNRTPGSTKDYLSSLEDVDLVVARQKRYSFTDPLLRLWVRLHCRPVPPSEDEVAREVRSYAMARLPQPEPAMALVGGGPDRDEGRGRSWGMIEID